MKPIQRTAAAVLLLVLWQTSGVAQTQPPAGTLAGRVLDAGTGAPVPAAIVTLELSMPGLLMGARTSEVAAAVRSVVTGPDGEYRFTELNAGSYRLRIERLGYRAATLEVQVRRPVEAAVSVGLELEPIALEPVRVQQRAAALFHRARAGSSELEEARLSSERARQALFLTPDARMLTYADVVDGVTLGEGDVFRALQRFAGVSTRDDYTAELWTRGAPWTHTRVTFDGVPLFNPVHAVGVLSAISPEVLGSVFFHPGVQPAAQGGAAAGIVDLRSRPGAGAGELRGVADLSLASARLALDQRIAGRGSWVVAARRSHVGVLSSGLGSLGLDTLDLPYVFQDLAGRIDLQAGERTQLEASGLWEQDRIQGDVQNVLERTDARWGNSAGRITLRRAVGSLEFSQTVGASRFSVHTDPRLVRAREPAPSWMEPASRNEIAFTHLHGLLSPAAEAAGWSLGYELSWQRGTYSGPMPRYFAVKPDTLRQLERRRELRVLAAFGDARIALGQHVTLNPGVRIELGDTFARSGSARVAPRLALRFTLSEQQTISLAAGRSWQYVQAIALAGPSIHPAFHASHFWIWPDAVTPAIRADIVSAGSERWLGGGWLAAGNVFLRRAADIAIPDPTPGLLTRRPLYVTATTGARGAEVSLRRMGALWSASFGYAYGRSTVESGAWQFAAPADRRHTFDAMLAGQVVPSVRLAAAFTAMSGAPFTRAYAVTRAGCTDFGFGCDSPDGSYVQAANAERTPAYRSLDAALQWSRAFAAVEVGAYLQVRNVLGRNNASTYSGSRPLRRVQTREGVTYVAFEDRFEPGLPRLPLAGLRVTF